MMELSVVFCVLLQRGISQRWFEKGRGTIGVWPCEV